MKHSKRPGRSISIIAASVLCVLVVLVVTNPAQHNLFKEYIAVASLKNTLEHQAVENNITASFEAAQKQEEYAPSVIAASKNLLQSTNTSVLLLDGEQEKNNSVLDDEQHTAPAASLQHLPRQNRSRALCGTIPSASIPMTAASGFAFPRVLATDNDGGRKCRPNAIVYMVQKGAHSSYGHNSTALFIKSLDSLYRNYLSLDSHSNNTDVLIFHSGDYTNEDLQFLNHRYHETVHFKLIDLSNTEYWLLPESVRYDVVSGWTAHRSFSIGYRHMIRWYALKLYDFVRDYAAKSNDGCYYDYIMRMDEDSFLHSPIDYDLFQFMESHNYSYAFRMCSYELDATAWDDYVDHIHYCGTKNNSNSNHHQTLPLPPNVPYREIHGGLCAFYNNFFIVHTPFMWQPEVQQFLQWTDATGIMYRERYNDLQIQTILVYAFLPAHRIHRFLDWTYEHMSYRAHHNGTRCPYFGALQAGYLDRNVTAVFTQFAKESRMYELQCPLIRTRKVFYEENMSPTYSHLPPSSWWKDTIGIPRNKFHWRTLAAGYVERPNRGTLSG